MRAVDLGRMLVAGAAGATLAIGSSVHADEPCAHVVAPQPLAARWAGAVDELRRQVALLPASDCRPMTLSVEPSDDAVRVVVTTADGRHATRAVTRPEGLAATALGLLLTIPADAAPETPAQPAAPPANPVLALPALRRPAEVAPTERAPAPRSLALWAGLGAGVRLTAPTAVTVFDVEARVDVMFDRWLLMSTIRSALVSCLGGQGVDCDVYEDVSFGVGVARRIRMGTAAVDLGFEPSVAWMHMEYDLPGASEADSVAGSEVALRLDASARLAVPLSESWALTLTLDAGLAPTMLGTTRLDLPASVTGVAEPPPFPAWTGGVRVGASGALL